MKGNDIRPTSRVTIIAVLFIDLSTYAERLAFKNEIF